MNIGIDQFVNPEFLWLLIVIPMMIAFSWIRARRGTGGLQFSDTDAVRALPKTVWIRIRELPNLLRMFALAALIVAIARPQATNTTNERFAEGIDIMIVLDVSTSMKAEDFQPNRFRAAKSVASSFIASRISDRVGLIVFAAQAYTQAPLTLDYEFLQTMLGDVQMDIIEDGTAIGSALATAVNRLKESEAEKVVILLTDGQNNHGEIDPVTASDVAAGMGVRVYTIGVGKRGTAPYPVNHPFYGQQRIQVDVEIDEEMLRTVADKTGGRYFRATNRRALESIYEEISELEKTKIEERIYTDATDLYPWFLWIGAGLILLEIFLRSTRLRTFP